MESETMDQGLTKSCPKASIICVEIDKYQVLLHDQFNQQIKE